MSALPRRKVMIVDDHPVVRAGIATVLGRDPSLEVCCEAGSERDAIERIADCVPDLAIVDLSLTNTSGFLLFRRLLQSRPSMRILVLSMHDETVYAQKVLQAGAHGYLMKGEAVDALLEAAHAVLDGQLWVSAKMRNLMLSAVARGASAPPREGPASLSRTELTVLQLIGAGASTSDIADRLKRSVKTIDTHRANIRRKLDLPNANALMHFAIQWATRSP